MTLYELTDAYQQLWDMIDDPDIDEDVIIDTLEGIDGEIEEKADGYAKIMAQIDTLTAGLQKEEERLSARRTSLENRKKWLKKHLQACMEATGKTKFKTDLFSFNIQNNGGIAPLILDTKDYEHLPENMRTVTYGPNNKAIRDYLKAGNTLEWARIGERGKSLIIK